MILRSVLSEANAFPRNLMERIAVWIPSAPKLTNYRVFVLPGSKLPVTLALV